MDVFCAENVLEQRVGRGRKEGMSVGVPNSRRVDINEKRLSELALTVISTQPIHYLRGEPQMRNFLDQTGLWASI